MEICKECSGTDIKSRKNYTHGKKSKATLVLICKKCGSRNVEVKPDKWKNKGKRR